MSRAVQPVDIDALKAEGRSTGEATYRVKDVWQTLQGEGFWAGRPAVFCRFVACNMWSGYEEDRERDAERSGADCPLWCDTDFTKEGSEKLSARELAQRMADVGGDIDFCVLTGGEPFLQADAELVRALHEEGFQVATETNGTVRVEEAFADDEGAVPPDWIVCSPKLPDAKTVIEYCHELKLVVPDYSPAEYPALVSRVREQPVAGRPVRPLWLQPEDGPRVAASTRKAVEMALNHPAWRVSVQTHKVLGVR